MSKDWARWWKAALIRALKTFAQAMVAQIGAGSIGIVEFGWEAALSVSAMAAVLSLFTSLAGLPEVEMANTIQQGYNIDHEGLYEDAEVYEDEGTDDEAEEQ